MFTVLALYKINKIHYIKWSLYYSANNIHKKITQFWLAEKGEQFSCNKSANYKWFLIGWKYKRNQREPITIELF